MMPNNRQIKNNSLMMKTGTNPQNRSDTKCTTEETKSDVAAVEEPKCSSSSRDYTSGGKRKTYDWQTEMPPSQALVNAIRKRAGGFYDPVWVSPFTITEEEYRYQLDLLKRGEPPKFFDR